MSRKRQRSRRVLVERRGLDVSAHTRAKKALPRASERARFRDRRVGGMDPERKARSENLPSVLSTMATRGRGPIRRRTARSFVKDAKRAHLWDETSIRDFRRECQASASLDGPPCIGFWFACWSREIWGRKLHCLLHGRGEEFFVAPRGCADLGARKRHKYT